MNIFCKYHDTIFMEYFLTDAGNLRKQYLQTVRPTLCYPADVHRKLC